MGVGVGMNTRKEGGDPPPPPLVSAKEEAKMMASVSVALCSPP